VRWYGQLLRGLSLGQKEVGWAEKKQSLFFKLDFQTDVTLFHSKSGLPGLKSFLIKYEFVGFEIRNNSPYINFFKFKKDFE
jgi:hypothetical protein